jgi:hypothetical protein
MHGRLLVSLLFLCTFACKTSGHKQASPVAIATAQTESYEPAPDRDGQSQYPPATPSSAYSMSEKAPVTPGSAFDKKARVQTAAAKQPEADRGSVVYEGDLRLRVKRVTDAIEQITRLTEDANGYIESMTSNVAIVRVPAQDFETVLARFAAIGEVIGKSVRALDVTSQLTDLQARLQIAKISRARLLALFEREKRIQERLNILASIKRLSEQIEGLEAMLATLANRVEYFTITISLTAIVEQAPVVAVHTSPFPWIRGLTAQYATLFEGKDEISMTLPKGFVLFDQDETYRAQSADTTILRAASIDNDPLGDAEFWARAVECELDGRAEELVDGGTAGKMAFRTYRDRGLTPRYYLVGVVTSGDKLFVVEAFFPNQHFYQLHKESLEKALATFEVRS